MLPILYQSIQCRQWVPDEKYSTTLAHHFQGRGNFCSLQELQILATQFQVCRSRLRKKDHKCTPAPLEVKHLLKSEIDQSNKFLNFYRPKKSELLFAFDRLTTSDERNGVSTYPLVSLSDALGKQTKMVYHDYNTEKLKQDNILCHPPGGRGREGGGSHGLGGDCQRVGSLQCQGFQGKWDLAGLMTNTNTSPEISNFVLISPEVALPRLPPGFFSGFLRNFPPRLPPLFLVSLLCPPMWPTTSW